MNDNVIKNPSCRTPVNVCEVIIIKSFSNSFFNEQ